MNKKLLAILGAVAALSMFVSCDGNTPDDGGNEHEHSYQTEWSYNETDHWHACEGEDCAEVSGKEAHHGGTATHSAAAVCEDCGQSYGTPISHSYTITDKDGEYHWNECACGAIDESSKVAHNYEAKTSATEHWEECACGAEKTDSRAAHSYTVANKDGANHWNECACGAIDESTKVAHNYEAKTSATEHWEECACGAEKADSRAAHSYTVANKDGANHWNECACGAIDESSKAAHSYTVAKKDGTNHWNECACGAIDEANKAAHSYAWKYSETEHWEECACEQEKANSRAAHSATVWTAGTEANTKVGSCVCGGKNDMRTIKTTLTTRQEIVLNVTGGEVANATATVSLAEVGADDLTVTKVIYGDNVELTNAQNEATGNSYTISLENMAADQSGEKWIIVTATTADGASHDIYVPVLFITKEIKTLSDLSEVAYTGGTTSISGYFVLANDINGNGNSLTAATQGSDQAANGFRGTFDGRNHKIYNYTSASKQNGIFGAIGQGAVIKDLTIQANGAIAVLANAARSATIENVNVTCESFDWGWSAALCFQINGTTVKNVTVDTGAATTGSHVLCQTYDDAATFENVTVKTSLVVTTDSKGIPAGVTVIAYDTTAYYAENGVAVTLKSDKFKVDDEVSVNGTKVTVTTAGEVTATLSGLTVGTANTVECIGSNYGVLYNNVICATKVIKTIDDLAAVKYTGTNITGYYVLGGDINGNGATISDGTKGWSQNHGFCGDAIFDGRGYTISNITVSGNGIFGTLGKSTVKNVKFTDVTLSGGSSLFAHAMYNTKLIDVSVTYASIGSTATGMLVGTQMGTNTSWTRVTLTATGIDVPNVLGNKVDLSTVSFTDVVINAKSVALIGTGGQGADKTDEITAAPAGVTINTTATEEA